MTDSNDVLALKDIVTVAGPFIKSVVDTFVTPKLEKLKRRLAIDAKKYYIPTEENFTEYLHRTYKRVSIINTLVFNNSQRLLKEIYQPLTLVRHTGNNIERYRITDFPGGLLNNFDRLLITDNAGMGKSTLVKKIFLDTIDHKIGIPVLVELRRLSKDKSIIKEIQEQVDSLAKGFDTDLLLELLSEGGFLIFLDGYDEIPLSDREAVTIDIQTFIQKAASNKFILTSRPESALKGFGDFQEVAIEPLKRKEAFELLRKYDKQGQVSTLLIKKLEESGMDSVSEFLTNPLLVSLLFTAFQHRQAIPFKKHIFYRQVYDANFESHDLTKGDSYTHDKYSKLEIDDFHRVLRHVAFSCLKDNQRIEFNKDELLSLISKARVFCVDLKFNDSDFLKDLLTTVPLFTQDGNYFRWAHKSLQEYFAAQFIYLDLKDQKERLLLQLYNHPNLDNYINILDLYYDIDTKTFRSTILYELLKEFRSFFETKFILLDDTISRNSIELRKELSFFCEPFVYLQTKGAGIPNENFDKMLSKMGNKRVSGSVDSPNSDNLLCCLCSGNTKERLLVMLFSKLPDLFKGADKKEPVDHNITTNIKHGLGEFYEPHFLNFDGADEFNSKENFEEVNRLILNTKIHPIHFKAAKALELLSEIEGQIEVQKSENFLL